MKNYSRIRKTFAACPAGSLHKALKVPAGEKLSKAVLLKGLRTLTDKKLRAKAVLVLRFHHKVQVAA